MCSHEVMAWYLCLSQNHLLLFLLCLYPPFISHSCMPPSIFRNNPGWGQQEGASNRPDSPGAAAGCHLRQEPPPPSLPHAGPGWSWDRVLQAGRDKRLSYHCLRPNPQWLTHLPLCGTEEANHMLWGKKTPTNNICRTIQWTALLF